MSLTRARHGAQGAGGSRIHPDSAAASAGAPSRLATSRWQDGARPSGVHFWAPQRPGWEGVGSGAESGLCLSHRGRRAETATWGHHTGSTIQSHRLRPPPGATTAWGRHQGPACSLSRSHARCSPPELGGQPLRFPTPLHRSPGVLEWTDAPLSAPPPPVWAAPGGKQKCSSKTTPWHHLKLLEPLALVRLSRCADLDPLRFLPGRSQP